MRPRLPVRLPSLLLVTLALGGCSEKDTTAPAPPFIDPFESPVTGATVRIDGSAEFGARIEMTGATFVPQMVYADPYVARFTVEVTLAENTTNTLVFTATDAAGNTSEPTTVVVDHETGHGEVAEVALDLYVNGSVTPENDPVVIAAGDTLRAAATATDAAGHLVDVPIVILTSIPGVFVAGSEISNITVAGDFRVAATVAGTSLGISRPVTVGPGPVTQIDFDASPPITMAGSLVLLAATARDAYGNAVPGAITLSSTPALAETFTPPCSAMVLEQGFIDPAHFVAYDLSGVSSSGYLFTLTATSGVISKSLDVQVLPAGAARFAPVNPADCAAGEVFAFTDATWTTDLVPPVSVPAGSSLHYRYQVIDAFGNPTTGPVSAFTNAPGAVVIDDGVTGRGQLANLVVAGSFQIAAYIAGVAAPAVRTFSVDVGAPNTVDVFLSGTLVAPGDGITAFAMGHDAFGNTLPCPPGATVDPAVFAFTTSPAGGVPSSATSCLDGLFRQDFTFTVNDTYAITGTYFPGGPVASSAYVTVLGFDATPPMVTLQNLRVNGALCTPAGVPPACTVSPGDTVDFELVATDNVSISEIEYTAFFTTTGALRTRKVLVAADTPLPVTLSFFFNVPGGALPESVPLVGLAIDGAGNRSTSDGLILSVDLFTTTGGRVISVVSSGGVIQAPRDLDFDVAGNMFIGNDGNNDLVSIAAGSTAPFVFSGFNQPSEYLVVGAAGDIYVSDAGNDVWRVSSTGTTFDSYINFGGNSHGLSTTGAVPAKGVVNATLAPENSTLTVGTVVYEFDQLGNGCGGGVVCLAVSGAVNENQVLCAALLGNPNAVGSFNAAANRCVLAAIVPGEAGNTIPLLASSGLITTTGAGLLSQGHGPEFFLGQTSNNNVYRFPEDLTPTAALGANHGAFNLGANQRGIAVRDWTTPSSENLRDLYVYSVNNGAANFLRSHHFVDSAAGVLIFNVAAGGSVFFNSLYDLELEPATGCLLVSDTGTEEIYAVDVRDPLDSTPTVQLIASGFNDARGIAFFGGDLYLADAGFDAIIRISPSALATDCF